MCVIKTFSKFIEKYYCFFKSSNLCKCIKTGEQSDLQEMCCKQQKSAHPIKENRCFMRFFAILGKKQGLPNGSPYGARDGT